MSERSDQRDPEPRRETGHRPTVADVDPSVLAVDALPDETRVHSGGDETGAVQSDSGDLMPTSGEDGDHVEGRLDGGPQEQRPNDA